MMSFLVAGDELRCPIRNSHGRIMHEEPRYSTRNQRLRKCCLVEDRHVTLKGNIAKPRQEVKSSFPHGRFSLYTHKADLAPGTPGGKIKQSFP